MLGNNTFLGGIMMTVYDVYDKLSKRFKNVSLVHHPLYDSINVYSKNSFARIIFDKISGYIIVNGQNTKNIMKYVLDKKIQYDNFVIYNDSVYPIKFDGKNSFIFLSKYDLSKYHVKINGWRTDDIFVEYDKIIILLEKGDDYITLKLFNDTLVEIECNVSKNNYTTLLKLIKKFKRNFLIERILKLLEKVGKSDVNIKRGIIDIYNNSDNNKKYFMFDFNSITNNFEEILEIIDENPSFIQYVNNEPKVIKFANDYYTEIIYEGNCKQITSNDPSIIAKYINANFIVNGFIRLNILFGKLVKVELCKSYNSDIICNNSGLIDIAKCITNKINNKDVRVIVDDNIIIDVFTNDPVMPTITFVISKEGKDYVMNVETDEEATYIQSKFDDENSIINKVLKIVGSCGVKIKL